GERIKESVRGQLHAPSEAARRAFDHELAEELGPGIVQTLSHPERVQFFAELEAERQRKVAATAESLRDDRRRVTLQDSKVLTQYLAKRPVSRAMTVREAASRALKRLWLLLTEPHPQLLHEA